MRRLKIAIAICALPLAGIAAPPAPAAAEDTAAELHELRDRAAIHELLLAYGRTIDERDFDAFGALFTQDGEYGGNRGPEAIAAGMRQTFASNPLGFREPNFHVFFNETIEVKGPRASARSMSFYVVPDDQNGYRIALMAAYEDELVKTGGEWKFRRRTVKGLSPAAPAE
jgi:hypothetical protein